LRWKAIVFLVITNVLLIVVPGRVRVNVMKVNWWGVKQEGVLVNLREEGNFLGHKSWEEALSGGGIGGWDYHYYYCCWVCGII
jgi:hypothetical protein